MKLGAYHTQLIQINFFNLHNLRQIHILRKAIHISGNVLHMQEFSGVSYRYRYVNTVWDVEQGQYIFLRRSGLISI